ncbi:MAG: YbaB/EbfC family nucleoid-associated protein [Planctomycetes bacterium]|nr:YbaB/EbfC family nucleoid-associated protein [Planctomycetota bacterium]
MIPGGMNMKALQEMQKKLARAEEDLKERVVEGSAGGAVKVGASGAQQIVYVKIDDNALADKAMLEDMVAAAANQALEKAKKMRETEMAKVTGMAIPGLM